MRESSSTSWASFGFACYRKVSVKSDADVNGGAYAEKGLDDACL
jgi:carbohydrate-binding DOMON domain-containing protein